VTPATLLAWHRRLAARCTTRASGASQDARRQSRASPCSTSEIRLEALSWVVTRRLVLVDQPAEELKSTDLARCYLEGDYVGCVVGGRAEVAEAAVFFLGHRRVPPRAVLRPGMNMRNLAVEYPAARVASPVKRLHAARPPAPQRRAVQFPDRRIGRPPMHDWPAPCSATRHDSPFLRNANS
jgi:hypothetical protein